MAQSKQHKKSRLGHWAKVVVMFLSGGFIFPHALTEDEDIDIAKHNAPPTPSGQEQTMKATGRR
jgi:hypothetical protein